MSSTSQSVDQGIEVQVFGRQPLAEDWLKDIRIRSSLVFMSLSAKDLSRLFTTRLIVRSGWAVPHAERIVKGLDSRTEAFRTEALRLREAVEGSATLETSAGTTLSEAYQDEIDCEVRDFMLERQRLQDEWNALKGPFDPRAIDRVGNVQKLIDAAVLERGSERGMLLREARTILTEMSQSQTVVHPVVWLYLGWTMWQLSENWVEVAPILAKAAQHPAPTTAAFVAMRLMSDFAALDDMPIKAYEWSRRALEIHQTAEAFVDAGLCAAALHDPSLAKSHFENALVLRAGSLIAALADERVLNCGSELIEVAVRVQMRLRRDGRQTAAAWAAAAREVAEAQRLCGGGLHMPFELMEAHKGIIERLDGADLVIGGYVNRLCKENAIEVVDHARKGLQGEYAKRCDAVSMARRSIEHAGMSRDHRMQAALQQQEETNRQAKAALAQCDLDSEKTEKNSVFGFGSGCAMFALYMVSYVILADRGIVIGITTPIGIGATVVSAIPILSAVCLQIGCMFKRMALENRANEIVKQAANSYEEASRDADDNYRDQMKHCRKNLSCAESELRKVESAMRSLGIYRGGVGETESEDGAAPEEVAEPGEPLPEEVDMSTDEIVEPAA